MIEKIGATIFLLTIGGIAWAAFRVWEREQIHRDAMLRALWQERRGLGETETPQ